MGPQVAREPLHHLVVPPWRGVQHGGALQVDEQRDVVLSPPGGRLVDPHLGDARVGPGVPGQLDVVVQDPPQPGVVLAGELGRGGHRHVGDEGHEQGLEQQGEPGLGAGPRHGDLADAVGRAGHPGDPGVQVRLVLEEVEVPPRLVRRVVDRAGSLVALGTCEARSPGEVEVQVEAVAGGVEVHGHHSPRVLQSQRGLEQLQVVHDGPPHLQVAGEGPSLCLSLLPATHSIQRGAHWFTFCEPLSVAHFGHIAGELAPAMKDVFAGLRAAHHINMAHGRSVQAFRASGAAGQIGTATLVVDVQPASDTEEDIAAADRVNGYFNELFLDPVMLGRYPQRIVEWLGEAWPPVRDGDLEVISTPIDFVGVTYYFGQVVSDASGAGGPLPDAGGDAELFDTAVGSLGMMLKARMAPASDRQTGLGWPIYPEGATRVLKWISDRYGNPPIIVTENGVAFDDQVVDGRVDDGERIDYLRDHFIAAHHAIEQGVDLRGWYVWALLDTWEFSLGFKGRFGLIHVNYDTLARTIKDSGRWFAEVMANNGLEGL